MNKVTQSVIKRRIYGRSVGRWLTGMAAWLLLALVGTQVHAASLTGTSFVALPGNQLEVRLEFDEPPAQPRAYMIESPARVVMDLWGISNGLNTRKVDIKSGQVDSLQLAEVKGRTRLIANLYEPVNYSTHVEGRTLYLVFGSGVSSAPASAAAQAPVQQRTEVKDIDFRRLENDQGHVIITLSDNKAGVDIVEEGSNVVINLIGARLPGTLEQRLDVQDFSTPVNFIDALAEGNNTSILVKPTAAPYDYLAYQSDNRLTLVFKPLRLADEDALERKKFPYEGEKLTLNFQEIDIRSVLQIIADVTDLNLVVSDTVAGSLTLRLKNVPWDQALDLVLKTKNLDKRIVGNVMMVAPAAEIAERERFELESNKQKEELEPPQTEFLQVNYAKASEVAALLTTEQGMLSERGSVRSDERTNMLIVSDTPTNLARVRRALKKLDVAVRQVMIEARIVTVTTDLTKELGVRWGAGYAYRDGARGFKLGSDLGTIGSSADGVVPTVGAGALNVDLGATNVGASSVAIGIGTSSKILNLELSALESDGKAEIVSQPKIITANGMPARIQSGDEIPFQTVEDGEVSVEFKEVVLSLDVTPQITPDDRLILDLKVNQDSVGEELPNGEVGIITNELETQVLVDNGETVVLGGVFKTERIQNIAKTPVLGDIPVLGNLFKRREERDSKVELLVFITPKIIEQSLTAR